MENSDNPKSLLENKKVWVSLLVLVIILTLGLVWFKFYKEAPQLESVIIKFNTLSPGEVASDIPVDILTEKDVEVIHTYTAISKENIRQSTLQYLSNKSLEDNINFFANYANRNYWILTAVSTTTQDAFYFYKKDNSRLSISVSYDQTKSKNIVDITVEMLNK